MELVFQIAFPHLPIAIIEQMPQYRARMGFQLDTEHGVQEYPAGEIVNFVIARTSGDLFRLTCLSPEDAPAFDSYRVSFQRDLHGFRNPEPWPDTVELAIIGDSFTAAEAIVAPFWREISDSMIVLGLPGSGTLQQQRLMEAYVLPRSPDIVVLAFFAGNDMQDNLTFHRRMQMDGSDSSGTSRGKSLLDYSVLFNIAYLIRSELSRDDQVPCHLPKMAQTEPPTPLAFYEEFLTTFALDSQEIRESEIYQITRDSIAAMAAILQANGAKLIMMYIPQKAELYWELLSAESKTAILSGSKNFVTDLDAAEVSANLAAQRTVMAELANAMDIGFLDLTTPLNSAISEGEQPYFFADTHWNQMGHNIARIALLDFLNQSNLDM